jgi:hypothetical protein
MRALSKTRRQELQLRIDRHASQRRNPGLARACASRQPLQDRELSSNAVHQFSLLYILSHCLELPQNSLIDVKRKSERHQIPSWSLPAWTLSSLSASLLALESLEKSPCNISICSCLSIFFLRSPLLCPPADGRGSLSDEARTHAVHSMKCNFRKGLKRLI